MHHFLVITNNMTNKVLLSLVYSTLSNQPILYLAGTSFNNEYISKYVIYILAGLHCK